MAPTKISTTNPKSATQSDTPSKKEQLNHEIEKNE